MDDDFLPGFFTDKETLLNYDFNFDKFINNNKYDETSIIDNLTLPESKKYLCESFFKSIIKGYYSTETGKLIKQNISNMARSNIIGFYDKPNRNLGKTAPPCRLTQFNANQPEKFFKVIPFITCIDRQFKKLIPKSYNSQFKRARKTKFVIGKTAFSTITVNYNWRTACHKDKGDYNKGFGSKV